MALLALKLGGRINSFTHRQSSSARREQKRVALELNKKERNKQTQGLMRLGMEAWLERVKKDIGGI
jgi:hypothetical protein